LSAAFAAALIGVGLAVSPAAAATTQADQVFEFVPFGTNTTQVSCTIHIRADFPFNGPNGARGITSVSGSDPACTTGVTTIVGAEYRDTNDDFVTIPYTYSHGTSHTQTYSNVKRDFTSFHQVYFPACGCTSQTYTLTTPNPK
jgi:hypothetical protein